MRKLISLMLCASLALSGCSTIGHPRGAIICQMADAATTVVALNKGATEANPFMKVLIERAGVGGFVVFKLALGYMVYKALARERLYNKRRADEFGTLHNAVTCGAAINNAILINRLP